VFQHHRTFVPDALRFLAEERRFRDQQGNVMNADQNQHSDTITSYRHAPSSTVTAAGVTYAYRELGPKGGIPVIFFVHLAGTLDNWDPRIIDPIAQHHHVIAFDNRGVGASTGTPKGKNSEPNCRFGTIPMS
jgi:hypothetical protein